MIFLCCLAFNFNISFSQQFFFYFDFALCFCESRYQPFDWPSNTECVRKSTLTLISLPFKSTVCYLMRLFFMVHPFTHRVQRFLVLNAHLYAEAPSHSIFHDFFFRWFWLFFVPSSLLPCIFTGNYRFVCKLVFFSIR